MSVLTTEVVSSALMEWQDLITEGRKAKDLSQAKLAKLVGVSQATIAKIEGKKVNSSAHLDRIIEELSLNRDDFPPEAFEERDPAQKTRASETPVPEFAKDPAYWAHAAGLIGDVPLFAAAEGGDGDLYIDREQIGTSRRPPTLQGVRNGYAIYLSGESMSPEFEPGDILMVNPRLPAISGSPCVFYNVAGDEPKATVKRLLGSSATEWHVQQHNPAKKFSLSKADWQACHRIVSKNFR